MAEEPEKVTLHIDNVTVSVDAHWLRRFAQDFLAAARSFDAPISRYSPIRHFLTCRSIELSLKSYLRARGAYRDERMHIGHNLQLALDRAVKLGLDEYMKVTPKDRAVIATVNRLYRTKGFEYFESLDLVYDESSRPDVDVLDDFAQRLVDAIEAPARDSALDLPNSERDG